MKMNAEYRPAMNKIDAIDAAHAAWMRSMDDHRMDERSMDEPASGVWKVNPAMSDADLAAVMSDVGGADWLSQPQHDLASLVDGMLDAQGGLEGSTMYHRAHS
jgi:hypothetical protein